MTVEERIADITQHLHAVEHHTKKLHKSLADGLAEHGSLVGLDAGQIETMSGGTKEN